MIKTSRSTNWTAIALCYLPIALVFSLWPQMQPSSIWSLEWKVGTPWTCLHLKTPPVDGDPLKILDSNFSLMAANFLTHSLILLLIAYSASLLLSRKGQWPLYLTIMVGMPLLICLHLWHFRESPREFWVIIEFWEMNGAEAQ